MCVSVCVCVRLFGTWAPICPAAREGHLPTMGDCPRPVTWRLPLSLSLGSCSCVCVCSVYFFCLETGSGRSSFPVPVPPPCSLCSWGTNGAMGTASVCVVGPPSRHGEKNTNKAANKQASNTCSAPQSTWSLLSSLAVNTQATPNPTSLRRTSYYAQSRTARRVKKTRMLTID